MEDWLFLNATADPSEIGIDENSKITFKLSSYKGSAVSNYDGPIDVELDLTQTLGELDKTAASLSEEITYTAKTDGYASVTGKFETASYTVSLKNKNSTEIILENETMNLKVGDETPAGATLEPPVGNLTYTSSDESVVTVENGIIKAVGDGTANVTVSFNGTDEYAAAERNISVSVSLNEAVWYYILQDVRRELDDASLLLPFGVYNCLVVNSTGQPLPKGLNVTIKLDDAYTINSTVGDDGIFEVDVNGITPKFYTATFSTYGYTSAVANVLIVKKPTSIALENETMALKVNDNVSSGATLNPAEAGNLTYKSSNESVIIVENGIIRAVGDGTANVTVSFNGTDEYAASERNISVSVSLNEAVWYYILQDVRRELDGASLLLPFGVYNCLVVNSTGQPLPKGLNVTIKLDDAYTINCTVGDYGIFEVDVNGITPKFYTATFSTYGYTSAVANVLIVKKPTSIALENETMALKVNDNVSSGATLNPAEAGNLTYNSSNSTVAIVENGEIKALAKGTTNITVAFGGNDEYAAAQYRIIEVTVALNDASVTVNNDTLDLLVGEEFTLVAEPVPAGLDVNFTSTDSSVVTVGADGKVTAVGNGTATIVVSVGDDKVYAINTTNVAVTVKIPTEINITNSSVILYVGGTGEINWANLIPSEAGSLKYSSNDTSVIWISSNEFTADSAGTALITVSFAGDDTYAAAENKTITVTVNKWPTEITLENTTFDLEVTDIVSSGATLYPPVGNLNYTSSNETVVKVENGMIITVGEGSANVTVSFKGDDTYAAAENKTISITVSLKDANVTANNDTLELFVGGNFTIVATTTPAGLNVTYVQDDSGVYTVDEKGTVTALKEGTGNILIKVGGDGIYAENTTTVTVTVSKIPTEISVAAGSLDLKVLENFTAGATLTPADAGNLTYTSSNKTVVIVEDGMIMALGEGTATITVSFAGNYKYAAAENKTIYVTVSLNDASVTVNNSTLDLFVDDNFTIVSTTTPTGLNVTYVQDDSGVYTVDEKGTVTALKEGTGNILIKVGGDGIYAENTTTVAVTVSKIPTEIIIANATLDVKVLNFTFSGATLNPSEAGNLTYNSTNSSIVMVISGLIIPVSQGNAIITVSYAGNDKYAEAENKTIAVTVGLNDASVTVENTTLDLKVGDTYTINATTVPEIVKLFNVTYTSSDESVVTVDEKGTVTAIGEGKAIITVGVGDDRFFAKNSTNITVTVNRIATEITASPVITVYNGGKYLITTLKDAEGNPLSGAQVTIDLNGAKNYTTDEKGQVKVSTNGLKPVKIYPATITFAGDEKYLKSTARVNVGVKKATPRITSFNKVFKSTVTNKVYLVALKDNRGNAMKNTRVTLRVGGVTYSAITNAKGIAVFRLTKLTKVGLYNALARYAGNSYYNAVAKKTLVKVAFQTVSKGSKDKAMVKKIQIALKKNGYYLKNGPYTLPIDGIYNTQTVKAVMQFQKAKGLKVTGKVDQRTAKKLKII